MKYLLIDVINRCADVVDMEDTLKNYYSLINCSTIDIAVRKIGGIPYDIICDDNGWFASKQVVSARSETNVDDFFVGNLLICRSDDEGNEVSLTSDDIKNLKEHVATAIHEKRGLWKVLLFD